MPGHPGEAYVQPMCHCVAVELNGAKRYSSTLLSVGDLMLSCMLGCMLGCWSGYRILPQIFEALYRGYREQLSPPLGGPFHA